MSPATMQSSVIPGVRDRAGNDPIFALNAEAGRRAAAGESILNATLGALINDDGTLGVMPTVLETFAEAQTNRAAGYAPISGIPAFREAVIEDLFGGTPLADQAVSVATPGGTGAIYAAVVNFVEPGQALLTTSFYWGPYREIALHSGRGIDTFAMFGSDGAFNLEGLSASLDRHIADQGRAFVILNFPCHNPTGYSLGDEEWRHVADVLARAGERAPVTVLIDTAYLRFGGDSAMSWAEVVPALLESCTVLVAWTASKAFTQYGARTGALVALHRDAGERDQLANALGYSCRATWSNCNHVGQLAVTDLLTDEGLAARCEAERGQLFALLQERIAAFNREAKAVDLATPRYEHGFFVAVFTPDAEMTASAMREAGVYVTPMQGAVRVALCSTPASVIPRLVESLREGVAAAG